MNHALVRAALVCLFLASFTGCGDDDSGPGGEGGAAAGGGGGTAGTGGVSGTSGSGGTNGGFGVLTGTGPDTATIGTMYTPTTATAIISDVTGAVSWTFAIGQGLTVGFLGDGTLSSVSLIFVSPSNVQEVFSWFLSCQLEPVLCEDIVVDLDGQSVSFDDATLPIIPTDTGPVNVATAPIVVDGTVSWN